MGLNSCFDFISRISLPTTAGKPPLAKWQAIETNISLVGNEWVSDSVFLLILQIPSGFFSKINEKIPLSAPIKYWSWFLTIKWLLVLFFSVSTPIICIVFLGKCLKVFFLKT